MKLSSIGLLVGVIASLLVNSALAATQTKVKVFAREGVVDAGLRFSQGMPQIGFKTFTAMDEDLGDAGESLEVLAIPDPGPATEGDTQAYAESYATAKIGKLGVSVVGTALGAARLRFPNSNFGGRAQALGTASATWLDDVTVRSRSPRFLRLVYNVFMEGDLTVSATGNAESSVSFSLTNAGSNLIVPEGPLGGSSWGLESKHPGLPDQSEGIPGAFRVELQAFSGIPTPIGLGIALVGNAVSDISLNENIWTADVATYSGEVSRTLKWGGLEGVFDLQTGEQLALDEITITSASGFDYTMPFPVPEPSGAALALVLLASLRCKRIRQEAA